MVRFPTVGFSTVGEPTVHLKIDRHMATWFVFEREVRYGCQGASTAELVGGRRCYFGKLRGKALANNRWGEPAGAEQRMTNPVRAGPVSVECPPLPGSAQYSRSETH